MNYPSGVVVTHVVFRGGKGKQHGRLKASWAACKVPAFWDLPEEAWVSEVSVGKLQGVAAELMDLI